MKQKITALLLAAVLFAAICPAVLAEGNPQHLKPEDISISVESVAPASAGIDILVKITVDDKIKEGTLTLENVTADAGVLASPVAVNGTKAVDLNGYDRSITVVLKGMFKGTISESAIEQFTFKFTYKHLDYKHLDPESSKDCICSVEKKYAYTVTQTQQPQTSPEPGKATAAFRLSSFDANGLIVPTAAGKNGGKVQVRLPLLCVDGPVSNIKAVPKLSTSLDEFPFAIEQVDYTIGYNGMIGVNQIIEFQFNLRFADKVTAGVKKVDFTITYDRGWASATGDSSESCDISLYVNVTRGYEAAGSEPGGETTAALPKIVVDSYSFSSDKIYAGEDFDLTFTVRNTSNEEETKSILVTVTNNAETGKLTPASGSNTLYIDKLGKGESKTMTMSIATAPDTEAKAYEIKLEFDYEGTKTRPATLSNGQSSASIPVTIMQKIRLKIEDPTVDGEPMEGESVPVYFSMYNMGRSSIYNCMVTVEGDGLSMEESFFQGTVAAGSTMRADFSLITATPGQIDGEIVITYEDSLEEKMEERLPLSLYVSEAYNPDMYPGEGDPNGMIDTMGGMEDPSASGGIPVWVWIAGGVVAAAAVVAVIIILKKKRARALEDV